MRTYLYDGMWERAIEAEKDHEYELRGQRERKEAQINKILLDWGLPGISYIHFSENAWCGHYVDKHFEKYMDAWVSSNLILKIREEFELMWEEHREQIEREVKEQVRKEMREAVKLERRIQDNARKNR